MNDSSMLHDALWDVEFFDHYVLDRCGLFLPSYVYIKKTEITCNQISMTPESHYYYYFCWIKYWILLNLGYP